MYPLNKKMRDYNIAQPRIKTQLRLLLRHRSFQYRYDKQSLRFLLTYACTDKIIHLCRNYSIPFYGELVNKKFRGHFKLQNQTSAYNYTYP